MKRIKILNHNGIDIRSYPDKSWFMVPFPSQKMPIYNNDNLATVNRPYFLEDQKFIAAHDRAKKAWTNVERDISWRLHVLIWAFGVCLSRAQNNKILMLELGTGKGYMCRGLANYYSGHDFQAYLCDSFTPNLPGLDEIEEVDNNTRFAYSNSQNDIDELLADINSYGEKFKLIKGVLPGSLGVKEFDFQKIDFLHVDLNSSAAELSCLELLVPNLKVDSIILFDDTGAPGSNDQYVVHKNFAEKVGRPILYLPTGQSLIF